MTHFPAIIEILQYLDIPFQMIDHPESHSCEESKIFRDAAWLSWEGSKNIVFHARGNFYIVTTLAHKSIRARNFKHEFGTKDIRFATQEEITAFCGSVIGSIPPFGFNKILPLYVDSEIFDHEYFLFNPDTPTKSISLKTADLRRIYEYIWEGAKFFDDRSWNFSCT